MSQNDYPRCATCRFFKVDKESNHFCEMVGNEPMKIYAVPCPNESTMVPYAYDTFGLCLYVGPDFGCVKHEELQDELAKQSQTIEALFEQLQESDPSRAQEIEAAIMRPEREHFSGLINSCLECTTCCFFDAPVIEGNDGHCKCFGMKIFSRDIHLGCDMHKPKPEPPAHKD